MKSLVWAGGVGLCGAVLMTACADSARSLNPTAPSSVMAGPQAIGADGDSTAASGAMGGPKEDKGKPDNPGNGNGNGNGNGGGKPDNPGKPDDPGKPENPGNGGGKPETPGKPDTPGNSGNPGNPHVPDAPSVSQPPSGNTPGNRTPPGKSKAEIEGLIGAIDGSTITVSGQVVTVPSSAVIRHGSHPFTFADLAIGDRVHVRAMRITVDGSVSLEASEVMLQDRAGDDDDDPDDGDDPGEEDPVVPTSLIAVGALDGDAAEAGLETGTFRFSRTGDTTVALTVSIEISGTATAGSDYENLPLTVTFAAGQATIDVIVAPLADATVEGAETIIVTVADGDSYDPGSPATATVTIAG